MPHFILIALLLVSCAASATSIDQSNVQTVDEFWLYQDATHHFNQQSVLTVNDNLWQHIEKNSVNVGYQASTIWLKFNLTNTTDKDLTKLLDINYPLLDFVSLFEITDTQINTLSETGDSLPFSSRNIKHPNFVTPILLKPGTTHHFLLKIRSNAPIQTELKIWQLDHFQAYYRSKASLTFLYLGILISAALFNLTVYLFIREKTYLSYGLYAGSFALLMASQDAILFEYIFPNFPKYHNWSQLFLACCTISLTALFNLYFLNLSNKKPGKILFTFSVIPIVIFISGLLINYAFAIILTVVSLFIILPTCFLIGLIYSKGHENRFLYILAWSWLIIGIGIFASSKLGVIPFNLFTNHSIQLGSALELLTFAVALAKRLHTERETRIQAQQIIIDSSRQSAALQQELLYNATHNDITGLPNRNYFTNWLDKHIKRKQPFFVVLFRLSRITELDKTLGRDISNYALERFATALNSEVQKLEGIQCLDNQENFYATNLSNSTLGIVINCSDTESLNKQLTELINILNTPITINEMEIDPWVNIGYASYPRHGQHTQTLIRNAGIALDNSHEAEHHICSFHNNLDTYNERRLSLINELKNAIAQNQMMLHYQPLIETKNKKIIGAEALIRWPHSEYGMIMPDEFIEIAEQTGLIQAMSLWVLKSALQQLKIWQSTQPDFLMSINISAHNIQDQHFISAISILIDQNKDLASNIVLEITETQMMSDTQNALKNLWSLSELGLNIAIDDFGTGYSNLGYLKKLPASELKIDKTFIINLEDDKQNQVLVQTAIQMAHNLGLKVVAEGVESEKSIEILNQMGCDMCQGYHISKPIPAEQFDNLVTQIVQIT